MVNSTLKVLFMRFALLLFFVAMPLLELALLIKLGQSIGFWSTLMVIIGTAALGLIILQYQGIAAYRKGMTSLAAGKPPVAAVLDGTMLMIAGGLLIAPGLITDCLGLLLLIPPLRRGIGAWAIMRMMAAGTVSVSTFGYGDDQAEAVNSPTEAKPRSKQSPGAGPVIEGEFERIDEKPLHRQRDDRPK